ncbi:hypothetical protein KCP76_21370 [Salmonella enterica subsp. enterica serovar Weltevreden]|nr:hypothetical protein KCP76_21370 [Salmonella enterica subsp. enterica serovar Weltevreden]
MCQLRARAGWLLCHDGDQPNEDNAVYATAAEQLAESEWGWLRRGMMN